MVFCWPPESTGDWIEPFGQHPFLVVSPHPVFAQARPNVLAFGLAPSFSGHEREEEGWVWRHAKGGGGVSSFPLPPPKIVARVQGFPGPREMPRRKQK